MNTPSLKHVFASVAALLLVSIVTPRLWAQDAVSSGYNRGILVHSDLPETKRGTVVLHEAADPGLQSSASEGLTSLQQQARKYREQGLLLQKSGSLPDARKFFQKAVELDPAYAVAYNDLGILYESNADDDQAEQCYLRAVQIEPRFASAYSNLALFYENKRDIKKAAYYWDKRIQSGGDPFWVGKAVSRLGDIRLVLGEEPVVNSEEAIIGLTQDVLDQKARGVNIPEKSLAQTYFEQAQSLYRAGEKVNALKKATDAFFLDRGNKEIFAFIEKLQGELLSRN